MVRRSILTVVSVVVSFGVAFAVPVAQANTGNIIEPQNQPPSVNDGWQAANCTSDEPTQCSPETPDLYFKQAGGHPQIGFTQYIIQHGPVTNLPSPPFPPGSVSAPIKEPLEGRTIKTLRVDLPPGLSINPQATAEQCTLAEFEQELSGHHIPACKASTIMGREEVTLVTNVEGYESLPKGFVIPPKEASGTKVPVYNLVPNEGEPALFGFVIAGQQLVFLNTEVAWEGDYHESFTIRLPNATPPFSTLKSRLVNFGRSGNGTFITNPTTCFNPELAPHEGAYTTSFRAESYEEPDPNFPNGLTSFEAPLPEGMIQAGCKKVPFEPSLEVSAGTEEVDSPAAPTITTKLPFIAGGEELSESQLRNASVTFPQGMGLNPAAAGRLQACTNEQLGKGTRNPVTCPAASKIGTVEIESPPLPKGSLKGNLYLGQQLSRDPTSGEEFRVFLDAESARYGISMRLIGNVSANPSTGQLTTTFSEDPQVPFESVKMQFEGSKEVLSSPPICAQSETTSSFEPWSTAASTKTPSSSFTLSKIPGGGSCPTTLSKRPFAPRYEAKTESTQAGAYSPFKVKIALSDGQQELKGVNVTLPPGLTGKLAGIPYCSEAELTAAAANSGAAEQANPSCPVESMIGTTSTEAGTGPTPMKMAGKAYLAGPYKGAPLSMAVITPAVAGPFDLGTVVVRVALLVNPETAQVNAVSDPIPDVFGGVKLDLRALEVNLQRSKFMRNPTNCSPFAIAGTLSGGGSDPTNPAAFSSYPVSAPFQASACNKLGFKPKLFTRLLGGRKTTYRAQHPQLRAILEAREGDANLSRSALTLPHALFLDQSHIRTVCTRPQLAAQECPSSSVYGQAEAKTPLLSAKLTGPVYLVPSGNKLPDLVADLRGQVNVQLHGVISSPSGGIKTVFYPTPDVPVSKFTLLMDGGNKGLLVNSTNLCKKPLSSIMSMKAQNDKKVKNNRLPLKVSGC